jgi:SNF2 family DNA or RNA helicase
MSEFDFLDDFISGTTPVGKVQEPENYCKEHDLFNCWHHTTPELTVNEMKLADVTTRLETLSLSLDAFQEANTQPIENDITDIKHQQKDIEAVYRKMIADLNAQYQDRLNELYKFREEQRTLQYELDKLSREQANLIKQIAAEKLLKDIESKIDFLIIDSPWGLSARDYQLTDLKYMVAAFEAGKTGVLNACDMGLGKTFESIALDYCLQHLFQEKFSRRPTVLWLTAPSLIKQTVREIKRWNPNRMVIPIEGSWNKEQREYAAKMGIESNAIVVVNYEQMATNKVILNTTWDIVFADEVSKLKGGASSRPTKVWQNAKALLWEVDSKGYFTDPYDPVMKAKFFVPLSGTPIQNKPGDMWAYLHLFNPKKFPRLKRFEDEYAYGWPDKKVNFERLISVMSDQVIRRSKDDELDLPPKVHLPVEVEMTDEQRKLYEQMKTNFMIYLDKNQENNLSAKVVIEWIIRLWEIALYPGIIKIFDPNMNEVTAECQESGILDEAMEIIEQSLAAGEKVVVWSSWFKEPLYELQRRISKDLGVKSALYTGDQNSQQKDDAVVSFESTEDDSVQILLANMKSAGMGLNLQKNCSTAIFLDLWWNYATNEQAEDRLHRPGQEGPRVMYHQLQAADSVYAFVKAKADSKQEMAESIMSSSELRKGQDWITYLEGMI